MSVRRAFSLVEILFALVVLLALLAAVVGSIGSTSRQVRMGKDALLARILAHKVMEDVSARAASMTTVVSEEGRALVELDGRPLSEYFREILRSDNGIDERYFPMLARQAKNYSCSVYIEDVPDAPESLKKVRVVISWLTSAGIRREYSMVGLISFPNR